MRNTGIRTDILLSQGVEIPAWLEKRGGTRIFLVQFGGNGRRRCCVRLKGAEVIFREHSSVFMREWGRNGFTPLFESGKVLAIGHPDIDELVANRHLCWDCLTNTGRKKRFSRQSAEGAVYVFGCKHCGSEWEVTFRESNGNGDGRKPDRKESRHGR